MGKPELKYDPAVELQKSFDRWEDIFEHGCSDPFYPDGVNLHLVRNHIIHYRKDIEETYPDGQRPEIYNREIPPEVDSGYMARADEIRAAAKNALEAYKADDNYRYIRRHADAVIGKERHDLCIDNVLGYVTGLERATRDDDLVAMRSHRDPSWRLQSFERCAVGIRAALENPRQGQTNLFSLLCEQEDNDDYDENDDAECEEYVYEEDEEAYDIQ